MREAIPLVALGCVACVASRELTEGTALHPFVLGTDTEVEELLRLRSGQVYVIVADVLPSYDLDRLPVSEAEVTVETDALAAQRLEELTPGLYAATWWDTPLYRPGAGWTVTAEHRGTLYTVESPVIPPLVYDLEAPSLGPGTSLEVPMPPEYAEDHDQVIAFVVNADGELTWTTRPDTFDEWVALTLERHTPATVDIPGDAFPAPGAYGVFVVALARTREEATFSTSLRSALSDFTSGGAVAIPVTVQ